MTEGLVEDLRRSVAVGEVVVVTGAGVSAAASGGASAASWTGLLDRAVRYCERNVPGTDGRWVAAMHTLLDLGDVTSLLNVADQVTARLGGRDGGEYGRFLHETVGALTLADDRVPKVLVKLGAPVVTTNYDSLIEEASGWDWVTWQNLDRFRRVLVEREPVVAHLHGHWDEPPSVVLGLRSYDEFLGTTGVQGLQQALVALRSLVLIGVGDGASDPNWATLRAWARQAFGSSQHRHFRLCQAGEVDRLVAEHDGERIVPVPYGSDHGDLAGFLDSLTPKRPTTVESQRSMSVGALPALRPTVGRSEEVARLVSVVLAKEAGPALVLGPPGVGKTNLTIAALHDPVVANRFGDRRFFVRCDGTGTAAALIAELAAELGVPIRSSGADAFAQALAAVSLVLEQTSSVLVIDNAETSWESDTLKTEEILAALAEKPGVRLVVSLRGSERPGGPAWASPLRLQPLALGPARELFLGIAGERFDEPGLDGLLEDMGGLPLAIELLAHAAETASSIVNLAHLWHGQRSQLLARAGGQDRSLSIAASAEVSWVSPLLTEPARRLLSLLSVLPDGIAHEDLDQLLPDTGAEAAHRLRQRALAFDLADRLRTHPPLGHHVAEAHPPKNEDHERALRHYVGLVAQHSTTIGRAGGAAAAARLVDEAANIARSFLADLEGSDPTLALSAISDLAEFVRFTGAVTDAEAALYTAIRSADALGDAKLQAEARYGAGLVAFDRSDYDSARVRFEEALALFRQAGDVLGEANTIWRLGDTALARSDHDSARVRFEEALALFRQAGDVLGEGSSIFSLARAARHRSDYDGARVRFEEALALFRQAGDVLGEANSTHGLGLVALARSDYDGARVRFEEALALFQRTGVMLGGPNSIRGLGDIALARSDHDEARTRFEEARAIFRRTGHVVGEANLTRRLGLVALARLDYDGARVRFEEALALFRQVGAVWGEAHCIQGLAEVSLGQSDRTSAGALLEDALRMFRQVRQVKGEGDCTLRLGDIALGWSDHQAACSQFQRALSLYERIPEPYSIGQAHRRLARLVATDAKRAQHIAAAREAWIKIKRTDLVAELEDESG